MILPLARVGDGCFLPAFDTLGFPLNISFAVERSINRRIYGVPRKSEQESQI